ncbi:MAG: hypothetical protein JRN06_06580 [Nitrososphaerota archaeon]|nr:hypothetical protein [Nitrososphaerota archaeon]
MRDGIDKLLSALLANDRDEVYDEKEPLVRPQHAIYDLVREGEQVIPALTQLIQKYEKEEEGRYYIEYVIEILGRIGGKQCPELILRIILASIKADIMNDDSGIVGIRWLRKLGKATVTAIIKFVEANHDNEFAVMSAAEALEGIKDGRLVPLLLNLLEYPNPLVVQSALVSLRRQNDKSTVPRIIPLMRYSHENPAEQKQTREFAMQALKSLLRHDRSQLREIETELAPQSKHPDKAPARGTNWASIGWAYVEKRNGEAIIGYVDDSDRTHVFLHMPRIRDSQERWVDYFDYLEKRGISYERGPDFGCLAIAKNQIWSVKEIEPSMEGTSTHCLVCGNEINRGAFCGDECRGLFYVMYGNEIVAHHISRRSNHYEKVRLPSGRTVRAMFEAVLGSPPRLQEAADRFVQDYGIKPTRVSFRPYELLALYDVIDNSIVISSTKTGEWKQLGLWEAINLTLFEHLCECESWKFDDDLRKNIEKQRAETRLFVERVFGRCVRLGLMPPPPRGSFPTE